MKKKNVCVAMLVILAALAALAVLVETAVLGFSVGTPLVVGTILIPLIMAIAPAVEYVAARNTERVLAERKEKDTAFWAQWRAGGGKMPTADSDATRIALFKRFPDSLHLPSLGHWSASEGDPVRADKALTATVTTHHLLLEVEYVAKGSTTDGVGEMDLVRPVAFPLTEEGLQECLRVAAKAEIQARP